MNDILFVSPYAGAPAAGRVVAAGRNPMLSFYTVTEVSPYSYYLLTPLLLSLLSLF